MPCKSYQKKRPKHDHSDSYFYPARQLEKYNIRADSINLHIYLLGTEINSMQQIPIPHVYSKDGSELKYFPVGENLFADLFYRQGKIKNDHRRRMLYKRRRIIMCS